MTSSNMRVETMASAAIIVSYINEHVKQLVNGQQVQVHVAKFC